MYYDFGNTMTPEIRIYNGHPGSLLGNLYFPYNSANADMIHLALTKLDQVEAGNEALYDRFKAMFKTRQPSGWHAGRGEGSRRVRVVDDGAREICTIEELTGSGVNLETWVELITGIPKAIEDALTKNRHLFEATIEPGFVVSAADVAVVSLYGPYRSTSEGFANGKGQLVANILMGADPKSEVVHYADGKRSNLKRSNLRKSKVPDEVVVVPGSWAIAAKSKGMSVTDYVLSLRK